MKIIVRTTLGLIVGVVSGSILCGLIFALIELFHGANTSFGGIGIIAKPTQFAAFIGAVVGAVYGGIIGIIIGAASLGSIWGALVGLGFGVVLAGWVLFSGSNASLDSSLACTIALGGLIGFATGSLMKLLTKTIAWLSN
jgi:hypothetical protein